MRPAPQRQLAKTGVAGLAPTRILPAYPGPVRTFQLSVDSDAKCNPVDSIGSSTKKSGFPVRTPAFCSVSRGPSRLGEKEYRAPSMTPGVALRPRTQGGFVLSLGLSYCGEFVGNVAVCRARLIPATHPLSPKALPKAAYCPFDQGSSVDTLRPRGS